MEGASRLKPQNIHSLAPNNERKKIYSILIILILIFLSFFTIILVYEILYSRTNVGYEVLPFGSQIQNQRDKIVEQAIGWTKDKILPAGQNNSSGDMDKIINPEIGQLTFAIPPNSTNENVAAIPTHYDNFALNNMPNGMIEEKDYQQSTKSSTKKSSKSSSSSKKISSDGSKSSYNVIGALADNSTADPSINRKIDENLTVILGNISGLNAPFEGDINLDHNRIPVEKGPRENQSLDKEKRKIVSPTDTYKSNELLPKEIERPQRPQRPQRFQRPQRPQRPQR